MCVRVFPDCPKITAAGLWNIGKLTKLRNLEMKGLSFDSINAVVLARLHYCTKLRVLELGDSRSKPIDTIPPKHVVRSVLSDCTHTHTQAAIFTHPDVHKLAYSCPCYK